MKNLLKLSLVFAVVLTTMTARANDNDFFLYVKSGDGKLISFTINGIKQVNLSIYDKEGREIFSEKASGQAGVKRTYSLEEFPAGKYVLEAENNFKKIKYEIVITDIDASLSNKALSQVYKQTPINKGKLANNLAFPLEDLTSIESETLWCVTNIAFSKAKKTAA
jgi:hypothetical protein